MSSRNKTPKHPFHRESSSYPIFLSANKDIISIRKRWHPCQVCENIQCNASYHKQEKYYKRKRIQLPRNSIFSCGDRNNNEEVLEINQPFSAEQRNQQNNVSELKFDGMIEGFNMETKPVNWKLQKLEKDFLLSYLENALLRYNKQSCKNNWLPSKNRDYYQKEPNTTKNCKELSTRAFMVRSLLSPFPNKTQVKHKFSQTDEIFMKPFVALGESNREFLPRLENMLKTIIQSQDTKQLLDLSFEDIQSLYFLINQIKDDEASGNFVCDKGKLSLTNKTNNLIPNLEIIETLSKDDSFKMKTVISIESSTQTDEDLPPQEQIIPPVDATPNMIDYETGVAASEILDGIKNSELRTSERYDEQGIGLNEPEIEAVTESHTEYKSHVQDNDISIRHSEEVDDKVDTLIEGIENVEDIPVKSLELHNDEVAEETLTEDIIEPVVENDQFEVKSQSYIAVEDPAQQLSELTDKQVMEDGKVAHFDMDSIEESSKEQAEQNINEEKLENIKILTSNFLNDNSERLLKVMTNKCELFEILLIINEIIKINKMEIPATEEMTSVFIKNLSTVQTEARLSRMTNEMDPGEEILSMYAEMNDFIDDALSNDRQMQLIVDNVQPVLENNIEFVSQNIREIVENPESFIKIITLIHHQYHHIDNKSLVIYFKSLPTFKTGSDSLSESNMKSDKYNLDVFLSDIDLMGNFLLILQLLNRRSNYIKSQTPTFNLDSIKADIENLKDWMITNHFSEADLEPEVVESYKHSNLFHAYKDYIQMVKQNSESNLKELFMDPEILFGVLLKIEPNSEIVNKMHEILNDKKVNLSFIDSPNKDLTVEEEAILSEILNDEELKRQILSMIDYWATENGQDISVSFSDKQISEDFLSNFKPNDTDKGVHIQMVSNLIHWLKSFINDADPDDTPEDIVLANFYSTNFYILKDSIKPDAKLNPIFQSLNFLLHLLLKLKQSLKMRLSSYTENVSFDVSQQGVPKSDRMKSEKTEPISSSPVISVAFGKNQRFSNSQADNKERFSDNNLESTYVNVSSLIVVKNNQEISIDDQMDEKIWDNDVTGKLENIDEPNKEIPQVPVILSRGSGSILKIELNQDELINHYSKKASFSLDEIFKRPSETDQARLSFIKTSPPPTASISPPLSKCESISNESKASESHSVVFERCDDSEMELFERCDDSETKTNENVVYVEKDKSCESIKLDETLASENVEIGEIKDIEHEVKTESIIEKSKSHSQHSLILDEELNIPSKSEPKITPEKKSFTDTDQCINEPEITLEDEKLSNSIDDIKQEVLQNPEEIFEENLSDGDISIIVEIEQETELVDLAAPISLQNPPETRLSGPLRLNNEDEDLMTTLGFMIYYLLAIISSKHIL